MKENKLRYLGILTLIILGSYTFVVAAGLAQDLADLVTTFTEGICRKTCPLEPIMLFLMSAKLGKEVNAVIEKYLSLTLPSRIPYAAALKQNGKAEHPGCH